jgi:uncharacterized membrane protein YccF (DUF307 family)
VQGIWLLLVGWWAGGVAISVAWFLNATIIGLPIGMAILNNLPKIFALQDPARRLKVVKAGDYTRIIETSLPQHSFLLRALFFLLIGWWWSAIWMTIAYALCLTLILMPIGLEMFRLVPFMTTLKRY